MIISLYPDNVLRQTCNPVTVFDNILEMMIDEMLSLMYASRGVGLAAPQIGSTEAYFVMDTGAPKTCINPKIVELSKDLVDSEEGCLSLPGVNGTIKRHKKITVEYQSIKGELIQEHLEGLDAVVFQHEFDHIIGKLFVDRLSPLKRKLLLKDYEKVRG